MEKIHCLSSSSSIEEVADSVSSGEEEEEKQDMMTLTQFYKCRRTKSSLFTPNSKSKFSPIPLSKVTADHGEGSTRRKRVSKGNNKAKSSVIERAKQVQANLDPGLPRFIKTLRPSHVSGEFKLRIPTHISNSHLPKKNSMIDLEDEQMEIYSVKYLMRNTVISVGWKTFCIAHELVEGDALVFQLVKPIRFKVYIVKASSITDHKVDACQKQIESCKGFKTRHETPERHQKTSQLSPLMQLDGGQCDSEESDSKAFDGGTRLGTNIEFKDIQSLESFIFVINGLIKDSKLSEQEMSTYYKLCCSQKAFLHDNLCETDNPMMTAGVIKEIVNIAEGIKASKDSTSHSQFVAWDNKLAAFEQLGMNVGFLRARTEKLMCLIREIEEVDSRRYREAIAGRDYNKEEIKLLKARLVKLEEASKNFDTEINTLELKVEKCKLKFRAEVDAPW